jgi:glycosyltransferase involved in cell wall biosynthesis
MNSLELEKKQISLTIVIPAYNEEHGIADICHRVLAINPRLEEIGISQLELIVVDDGSKDRTAEIVADIPGVRLIKHPQNKGYGAALKTGFNASNGELIGFLDADGTYPPEHFPDLCLQAFAGADIVVGSRRSGSNSEMPFIRRLGNFIWANLISLLGSQRVYDPASGMRVFHRKILEQIYPLPDGLNLTPIMTTRAIHEHVRLVEVPIPYRERVGRSKLSVIRDGTRFLNSIVWTVLTYNPVRILGMIGLIMVGLSVLIGIGLIIARLQGITTIDPWGVTALYIALVFGVTGVSIFALGATFNYLVSLFSKRPIRQGLFRRPVFKHPLERNFGWMGLVAVIIGIVVGVISLILGIYGWDIIRLWLYLLGSALFLIVGVQLINYWILIRVLEEISQRDFETQKDFGNE